MWNMCVENHVLGMQLIVRFLRIPSPYRLRTHNYVNWSQTSSMECGVVSAIGAEVEVKTL